MPSQQNEDDFPLVPIGCFLLVLVTALGLIVYYS